MYVLLYTYVVSRNFGMMPCCHDESRVVVESQKALSEVPPLRTQGLSVGPRSRQEEPEVLGAVEMG